MPRKSTATIPPIFHLKERLLQVWDTTIATRITANMITAAGPTFAAGISIRHSGLLHSIAHITIIAPAVMEKYQRRHWLGSKYRIAITEITRMENEAVCARPLRTEMIVIPIKKSEYNVNFAPSAG